MTAPAPLPASGYWQNRTGVARALDIASIGVAGGVCTGLLHAAVLALTRYGFNHLVWVSRDFAWMAPVAYTVLFAAPVLLLSALSFASRSPRILAVTVWGVATASVFGVLLPFPEIGRPAALVLAAGASVQLTRTVLAAPPRWTTRVRRLAIAGVIAVAGLAVLLPLGRKVTERRIVAALPPVSNDLPNVLFLVLDTVRAASMSLYGDAQVTTPHLADWAREGARFQWAFSVGPWTLPSHASMFTGRYAGELSTDWTVPLDQRDSTLAERFSARGYLTAGFVANLHYTAWDSGLHRGFARYQDYRTSWGQLWRSTSYSQTALFGQVRRASSVRAVVAALRHPDLTIDPKHHFDPKRGDDVATAFLQWQASIAPRDRPFFAFLNFFDAHQPYYAPQAYRRFNADRRGVDNYRASLLYLDAVIDGLLQSLRRRGVLDNTIVIVTSDHGELFGEHGLSGHAHNLYQNVLRVPLVIRYPNRIPVNREVTEVVSLRDLAATMADLAALPGVVPGRSLVSLMTNNSISATPLSSVQSPALAEVTKAPNVNTTYPTARGPLTALVDSTFHYIRGPGDDQALYRYRADSADAVNLAQSPDGEALLQPLRARIDSLLQPRRLLSPAR